MTTTDSPAAYSRLQSVTGTRTQTELAELLGIRQSSISDAKKRGEIPAGWLLTLLKAYRVNPEWIMSGEGAQYLADADTIPINMLHASQLVNLRKIERALAQAHADIHRALCDREEDQTE